MMKRYRNQKLHLHKHIALLAGIMILLFSCFFPKTIVEAASLKIRYGNKNYNYTSAQAGATIDGEKINLNGTPGILISDTCMLPARDVFSTALKAKFTYGKSSKIIKITQNGVTVKMTLDSKKAYINGKKTTAEAAPRMVKFVKANKSKLYVPARFVAEALGYTYTWNTSTKASDMKTPFVIKYDKDWEVYSGTQARASFNGREIAMGMPGIVLDNTTLVRANSVFGSALGADYSYDKRAGTLTIFQNGVTIVMTVNSKKALVNGVSYTMDTAARKVYNKETGKYYMMVPVEFTATALGYKYNWNAASKTAEIETGDKKYFSQSFEADSSGNASIVSIEASNVDKKDVLTITATSNLDLMMTEGENNEILLNISNVYTGVQAFAKEVPEAGYLKSVSMEATDTGIVIKVSRSLDCNYYSSSAGTVFKLILSENEHTDIMESSYQLKFNIPDEIDGSEITAEDLYYKNEFTITIPGDYVSFYMDNPISYDEQVVHNASVSMNSEGDTVITVLTNGLQGYKLTDCDTYIGVKIAHPANLFSRIVVLDAGHGGTDQGTSNKKVYEKDLNYTIIHDLAKEYFNSPDSDIKAYWSRYDDTKVPLADRAAFAEKVGADVFISLHMNSASSSASGTEVLYAENNKNTMSDMTSRNMAEIFQEYLVEELGLSGRKIVNRPNLVVLRDNTVPAILIELGFLSNKNDFSYITDPDFQDLTAKAIFEATEQMFDAYPTGREEN